VETGTPRAEPRRGEGALEGVFEHFTLREGVCGLVDGAREVPCPQGVKGGARGEA
jgi:hypothetical protein